MVGLSRSATFPFSCALLVSMAHTRPGTKPIFAPETAHIHTNFCKQHCGTQKIETWNGLNKLPFLLIGLQRRDDLTIDQRHLTLEPFDIPQDLLQHEMMPITDFALQRILSLLQPAQGLFGYLLRCGCSSRLPPWQAPIRPSIPPTTQPKRIPASSSTLWSRFFSPASTPPSFRR